VSCLCVSVQCLFCVAGALRQLHALCKTNDCMIRYSGGAPVHVVIFPQHFRWVPRTVIVNRCCDVYDWDLLATMLRFRGLVIPQFSSCIACRLHIYQQWCWVMLTDCHFITCARLSAVITRVVQIMQISGFRER